MDTKVFSTLKANMKSTFLWMKTKSLFKSKDEVPFSLHELLQ